MQLDEVVARWVQTWSLCRESTHAPVDGGWQVDLRGSAHRTRETVLAQPSAETVARYAAPLGPGEGWWLSVVTPEPHLGPLPAGVVVQSADQTLMTISLAPPHEPRVPPDPRVRLEQTPEPTGVRVDAELALQHRPAAVGSAAVIGSWAVVDRVRTYDAFQRRGLGTAVMGTLTHWAREQGATRAVLLASGQGRSLYTALGWQAVASVHTMRGAGPA